MTRGRLGRLILVLALALVVLGLLRAALFPFVLALVFGYVLFPLVAFFERALRRLFPRLRHARPLAIVLTYLSAVLALVVFFFMVVPVISPQFAAVWENRQEISDALQRFWNQGLVWYRGNIPADIQGQIDQATQAAGSRVSGAIQAALVQTISAVTNTAAFVAGLVIIPVWVFYLLNDQSRFTRTAVSMIPIQIRADTG